MIEIRSEDVIHKSYLNRLLIEIIDRPVLAHHLAFKDGSCAAMLGYLDRFSVDLDFDVIRNADESVLRQEFLQVFMRLDLTVTRELKRGLFYQIRYPSNSGRRNTLKVSASNLQVKANQYKVFYIGEIDRMCTCQTIETMFANKLVAVTERYDLHHSVAGRDIYDIHYFFVHGYSYHAPIITERTGLEIKEYFIKLSDFIKKHVNQTIINEDLNTLLPLKRFQQVRKILIPETLSFLEREIEKGDSQLYR